MVEFIKTLSQAEDYTAYMQRMTGNIHSVFQVPVDTEAYNIGYRFGTCKVSDINLYKADGVRFVHIGAKVLFSHQLDGIVAARSLAKTSGKCYPSAR